MIADSLLDDLLRDNIKNTPESEQRIQDIVTSARQETGLRDFLILILLRIWMPIISIGSILFVLLNRNTKKTN